MRWKRGSKPDEVALGWTKFSTNLLISSVFLSAFSAKALMQNEMDATEFDKQAQLGPAITQGGVTNEDAREFDEDAQAKPTYQITPKFAVGAEFETKVKQEVDFKPADGTFSFLEPMAKLSLFYEPASKIIASLELEAKRKFEVSATNDQSDFDWTIELSRAYVTLSDVIGLSTVNLGRQHIEDERAWLIKNELDGARVFLAKNRFGIDVVAARRSAIRRNLLESNDSKGATVYFLSASHPFDDDNQIVRGYLLELRGADKGLEDLSFIGVQSIGQLNERLNYWVDAAHVRGKRRRIDIRGYAIDFGGTYRFDAVGQPSLTAGVAFGSGGNTPDNGVDRAFRQTGLQKNDARFGGLPRIKYYGSTLDPELSNLIVVTAAGGIRPTKGASVDFVYHHYWQHKALDNWRKVAIDKTPAGVNKELGSGLDVICGIRFSSDVVLEATASAFFPGKAFNKDEGPAYFFELRLRFLV